MLPKTILFCLFLPLHSCSNGTENRGSTKNDTAQASTANGNEATATAAPQSVATASIQTVQEISVCDKKLSSFSSDVQEKNFSGVGGLMDSIAEMNKKITSLIIHHPQEDERYFIELLKTNTDIRVVSSSDSQLKFFTWADAPITQTLFSYITVVDYSVSNKRIIELFNNNECSVDTVYNITINNRQIYLVTSSQAIASAHIACRINAYEIVGEKIVALNIFKKDKAYCSQLNFEYFLNTKIKDELYFRIDDKKNLVYIPVLNKQIDSVVGEKTYAISLPK